MELATNSVTIVNNTIAVCSTKAAGVTLGAIDGQGYVDLRVSSMLVEPNVYAWNVTLSDGATGVALDSIPKVRFVINEAMPIPGIFGLAHEWDQPKKNIPTNLKEPEAA